MEVLSVATLFEVWSGTADDSDSIKLSLPRGVLRIVQF